MCSHVNGSFESCDWVSYASARAKERERCEYYECVVVCVKYKVQFANYSRLANQYIFAHVQWLVLKMVFQLHANRTVKFKASVEEQIVLQ